MANPRRPYAELEMVQSLIYLLRNKDRLIERLQMANDKAHEFENDSEEIPQLCNDIQRLEQNEDILTKLMKFLQQRKGTWQDHFCETLFIGSLCDLPHNSKDYAHWAEMIFSKLDKSFEEIKHMFNNIQDSKGKKSDNDDEEWEMVDTKDEWQELNDQDIEESKLVAKEMDNPYFTSREKLRNTSNTLFWLLNHPRFLIKLLRDIAAFNDFQNNDNPKIMLEDFINRVEHLPDQSRVDVYKRIGITHRSDMKLMLGDRYVETARDKADNLVSLEAEWHKQCLYARRKFAEELQTSTVSIHRQIGTPAPTAATAGVKTPTPPTSPSATNTVTLTGVTILSKKKTDKSAPLPQQRGLLQMIRGTRGGNPSSR